MGEIKKKILVVDDELSTRKSLVDELVFQGFDVKEAADGKIGLKIALKERPDLILLDIAMPKMTGLDVIHELRKDVWGKRVPIIFITQLPADDRIMKEIVLSEPSYYVLKENWSMEDLMQKINECMVPKGSFNK